MVQTATRQTPNTLLGLALLDDSAWGWAGVAPLP